MSLKVVSRHLPGGTGENNENSKDTRCSGRDSNLIFPQYFVHVVLRASVDAVEPVLSSYIYILL
jgi:hypothetical protein